jgi:hypothetical protein
MLQQHLVNYCYEAIHYNSPETISTFLQKSNFQQ